MYYCLLLLLFNGLFSTIQKLELRFGEGSNNEIRSRKIETENTIQNNLTPELFTSSQLNSFSDNG